MKHPLVLLFTVLFAINGKVSAQLEIDGRQAFLDTLTNAILASVPESFFNTSQSLSIALDKAWKSATIDGEDLQLPSHTFEAITATHGYSICATLADGSISEYTLYFTHLPVIQLQGEFDNDYHPAVMLLSDPQSKTTSTMTAKAKWRGGSTNTPDKHKRNYKVKLDTDTTLLGLRNDNNWILDAGQKDVFRLRNRIAMDVWNSVARPPYYADKEPAARSGVSGRVVEVFLNNEYRGIYNFSENLDRKQMRVKKVKSNGQIRGCLYKAEGWGYATMNDTLTIPYSNHSETWNVFEVKYPELSDNDSTDWSTLYNAIDFVVMSRSKDFKKHVAEYFDLPVIVDYWIFLSSTNAGDNGGKNMFWAVYDKNVDKKLTPAAWDLDLTFGQRWGGYFGEWEDFIVAPVVLTELAFNLAQRLVDYQVDNIADQLNDRYQELRQGPLATANLLALLDKYYDEICSSGAAQRETQRWSGDTDLSGEEIDFEKEYQYIRNWIIQHMEVLDYQQFPLYLSINDIEVSPSNNRPSRQQGTYTLHGQKLSDSQQLMPGLYIRNGRKIIIR